MEVSAISLEHTGRFNRLILDYVNGEEKLKDFYSLPHSLENYRAQIEARKRLPVNRELLADSLLKQYESIGGAKDAVRANIEALRAENTFTLTTGHQLNIFTGPLYFIYKILHTIRLADELNAAYPENRFVPIYWMNSEDHDLEEIGQFNLFGNKYVWQTELEGATGRMSPKGLTDFCDQLDEIFGNNPETKKLVSMFRKAYSEFKDLASATRYFVNQLFGERGLVIINSDDRALKASFLEYYKADILKNRPFKLLHETNRQLEANGYHIQVNPREINCFYLVDGVRARIVRTEKGFHALKTDFRFTEVELLKELEAHPERFSPNVVLRPLFQEFILPNLTYVGGAGELSYWLQYKAYFDQMGVSFPMLSLRNHFLMIDSSTSKRMAELNLLAEDMFHSVDELVKAHVLEVSDAEVSIERELRILAEAYEGLKEKAAEIDDSLVSAIEAEQTRVEKGVSQWSGRFARELKKKHEVSINRIKKCHAQLFPNGFLQERHVNFLQLFSKSESGFWNALDEATEPFSTQFKVIYLDQ